jgi:NADH-quinone oxidoreductase subunit L
MTIGALTLAGIPGLSGFFSKDLIVESAWHSGHFLLTIAASLTSVMTAMYAWRLISLAFLGKARDHYLEPHDAPTSMRVPMGVLAGCCILVGWIFVPIHWTAWPGMLLSAVLAAAGILVAWYVYIASPSTRKTLDARIAPLTKLLRNRWYIDAAFEDHFVEGVVLRTASGAAGVDRLLIDSGVDGVGALSRRLSGVTNWLDFRLLDGAVRFVSGGARFFSWPFRAVQSGLVQTYLLIFLASAIAALGYCLVR